MKFYYINTKSKKRNITKYKMKRRKCTRSEVKRKRIYENELDYNENKIEIRKLSK